MILQKSFKVLLEFIVSLDYIFLSLEQ